MDDLSELVGKVRAAGLPVDLVVDVQAVDLPAGMELAVYRIVQEALTNTLKHSGPGATARVEVRCQDHRLEVRVEDDGAGIRRPGNDSTGQGLAGMRERTAMYGGAFEAGSRTGGGFSVTAQFLLDVPVSA
jgi:signal transduction histidine kinase